MPLHAGGNQGRPTGPELRACMVGRDGQQLVTPCTPARNIWTMIMTNDWFYQKGNVSSTTGGAVTGGALAARRRRT
jgi:hypothetical protein